MTDSSVAEDQSADAVQVEENPYPSERVAWYVVGVLMVVYIFSFVDRQILSLMVGPIREDLNISETQMGLLMGPTFAIFYAIFGFPLGRLADSKSRRTIIAVGLGAWSLMTLGCGMARTYAQLAVFRLGVGVGEASLSPAAYSLITDYFRPARLATALSVYGIGIYIGSGTAFILGAVVIGFASGSENFILPIVGEVRPWQLVFFVISFPGLLFTAVLFTIREPVRRGMQSRIAGKGLPVSEVLGYIGQNWKTFCCHSLGFSCLSFVGYGSASWVPAFFIRLHGWERLQVGLYYGFAVIIFGTAGIVFGGYLADYLKKKGYADAKMRVGLISAICNLPMGIGFVLVPNGYVAYFVFMLPSTFTLAMSTGVAAAAIQEMMPNPMRGQASALYLFVVNIIGLGMGPLAVALCTDYLFGKDIMMVWASLLITGAVAKMTAIPLLFLGLKYFRESIARKEAWEEANA
jgi:MFS family permease